MTRRFAVKILHAAGGSPKDRRRFVDGVEHGACDENGDSAGITMLRHDPDRGAMPRPCTLLVRLRTALVRHARRAIGSDTDVSGVRTAGYHRERKLRYGSA